MINHRTRCNSCVIATPVAFCLLVAVGWGQESRGPESPPELIGPPTRYFVDVEHYRFGKPDVNNTDFYPIPQDAVTRDTYLRCIDAMNPEQIAANPNRRINGPAAFMPVLAKYVQTGDSKWSDACISMLQHAHADMKKMIAERKWFWQFEHPAALIPLYRKHLIEGGAMKPND